MHIITNYKLSSFDWCMARPYTKSVLLRPIKFGVWIEMGRDPGPIFVALCCNFETNKSLLKVKLCWHILKHVAIFRAVFTSGIWKHTHIYIFINKHLEVLVEGHRRPSNINSSVFFIKAHISLLLEPSVCNKPIGNHNLTLNPAWKSNQDS